MRAYWMTLAAATALAACGATDDPVAIETADGDTVIVDDADVVAVQEDDDVVDVVLRPAPVQNERYKELSEDGFCLAAGPQTPRDISFRDGTNADTFMMAPDASEMNLCNIHTHTNAEHKGPGFSVSAGGGDYGGFKCNGTDALSEAELAPYDGMDYGKVKRATRSRCTGSTRAATWNRARVWAPASRTPARTRCSAWRRRPSSS